MAREDPQVEIVESYTNYQPPANVVHTVRTLLGEVPPQYLQGLKRIVLTNASGQSHQRRRSRTWSRQRKIRQVQANGLYYRPWQGQPAWIELFVDNILTPRDRWDARLMKLSVMRNCCFAKVLYHEIGHHVHTTRHPDRREREDAADQWGNRFFGRMMRNRYNYILVVAFLFKVSYDILRGAVRLLKKTKNALGLR